MGYEYLRYQICYYLDSTDTLVGSNDILVAVKDLKRFLKRGLNVGIMDHETGHWL